MPTVSIIEGHRFRNKHSLFYKYRGRGKNSNITKLLRETALVVFVLSAHHYVSKMLDWKTTMLEEWAQKEIDAKIEGLLIKMRTKSEEIVDLVQEIINDGNNFISAAAAIFK